MKIVVYCEQIHKRNSGGAAEFEIRVLSGIHSYIRNIDNKNNIEWILISKLTNNKLVSKNLFNKKFKYYKYWINMNHNNYFLRLLSILFRTTSEQIIKKINPDLILSLGPYVLKSDFPSVSIFWDLSHEDLPFFKEFRLHGELSRRVKRFNDIKTINSLIIVGTNVMKNKLIDTGVFPNKVAVIPMPFQIESKEEKNYKGSFEKFGKFIFYPANFWPHKNHLRLIKAFSKFIKYNTDIDLYLSGNIPKDQIEEFQMILKDNLIDKSRLKHLGFLGESDYEKVVKSSMGLIYPSLLGPDNLPPIDFMSLNKPVAASNHDGHKEQTFNQCYYFDPYSVDQIENALNWIVSSEAFHSSENYNKSGLINTNEYARRLIDTILMKINNK